jgi:PAS domain S-box-containing protein
MATKRVSRNISLTPELDGFISDCLAAGDYGNASEVIRTALKLLRGQAAGGKIVANASEAPAWPPAGGECGALIRQRDWRANPLGPVDRWPPALRSTVSNIVNSPVAKVLMWGPDHVMLYNDSYSPIAGDRHPVALGSTVAGTFPELWDWNRAILQAGFKGEIVSHSAQPITFHRPGGPETLILDLFYTPVYDDRGRVGGVMCTIIDNSKRVDAERRLAAREAELRRITDAVPMLISYLDRNYVYHFANSAYLDWFGVAPEKMIGGRAPEVIGQAFFEERRPSIDRALAGESFKTEALLPDRAGPKRRCEIRYIPDFAPDGTIAGTYILAIDIEERAQREAMLAISNRRFRTAMDAVHGVLWTNSADGRMLGEQPGWAGLTGQSFEEYQGYGWADAVHPEDVRPTIRAWRRAVADKSMFVFEHRVRQRNGVWRNFAIRGLPILDAAGGILEWVGVHTDITHQRAAEAALREQAANLTLEVRQRQYAEEQLQKLNESLEARVIAEIDQRRRAEAKLAQAQKMETIGKLTGGVAHDFNNLLQIISGNLQLLTKDVAGRQRAEQRLANAMAGVSRGSKLASQLLAFGRRQPLEPKVVNITRFVRGMDELFHRALGEGIEVETIVGGGLWNTFIDPAQIENALLNLAINARDAMNGHGKLTIELGNASLDDTYAEIHDDVEPGQYVMLAVSDTGSGIAPELIDKVFEPFFSTKREGQGSGLGLSMVYGFVKQSGGHVKIYSEVGEGTTIRLYLPRARAAEDVEVMVAEGPVSGGTETILAVEDDPEVRATVVELLTDLGYRVLKAVDAASALSVIESGVAIDLLFSDVVMPGTLKSPELARKARERLPNVAVLFTSGYAENSIVHGGKLDAGVDLLSKPYTREALARKVRHVLANQKQRGLAAPPPPVPPLEPSAYRATILLVEDDAFIRAAASEMLNDAGFVVIDAQDAEHAMIALQTMPIDCLVTDINLPGISGQEFAEQARALRPNLGIVYATGDAGALVRESDAVMLIKPYRLADMTAAIAKAMKRLPTGASAPAGRQTEKQEE